MACCLPLSPTNIPNSILDVEFKIPMDCIECWRIMIGVVSKFKGVDKYVTDVENQKIRITGSFNQEKLLEKLMNKLGKEVEIVRKEEKNVESEIVEKFEESEKVLEKDEKYEMISEEDAKTEVVVEPNSDERKNMEKYMMFSDENPNAKCSIS